ncbi:3-deoxy-D-manno-octulosonate 8-phosphate phosphatase [Rhodocytophaga aerolata]|uniref:3-deoxy-D-manno-octulosonate 8-phosphate phosphatase n=1 Tax=Rhodocytophaga aerolata TaxID=455078 RepID=A0ABT8R1S7_9BACT|nr:3-deoxy-D-manno-octulosonate 8-phosphate phosphatase [Rhodocytophaga aerolata]MDO1445586.1 3-deoxy-D-manno-octulosonate 8-phosphate phosphatase [Rhodocytophaga aerolata]
MNFIDYDFKKISTFIFDVDGVLTDGTLLALESGEQARTFHIRDGFGIEKALQAGYRVAIISGGNQMGVRKRLEFLKVPYIYLGVATDRKLEVFKQFIQEHGLAQEEILYMGDDMPDYEVLKTGVLATCPQDAMPDIQALCHYISPFSGGRGAVRDVIERVMRDQGKWILVPSEEK